MTRSACCERAPRSARTLRACSLNGHDNSRMVAGHAAGFLPRRGPRSWSYCPPAAARTAAALISQARRTQAQARDRATARSGQVKSTAMRATSSGTPTTGSTTCRRPAALSCGWCRSHALSDPPPRARPRRAPIPPARPRAASIARSGSCARPSYAPPLARDAQNQSSAAALSCLPAHVGAVVAAAVASGKLHSAAPRCAGPAGPRGRVACPRSPRGPLAQPG